MYPMLINLELIINVWDGPSLRPSWFVSGIAQLLLLPFLPNWILIVVRSLWLYNIKVPFRKYKFIIAICDLVLSEVQIFDRCSYTDLVLIVWILCCQTCMSFLLPLAHCTELCMGMADIQIEFMNASLWFDSLCALNMKLAMHWRCIFIWLFDECATGKYQWLV